MRTPKLIKKRRKQSEDITTRGLYDELFEQLRTGPITHTRIDSVAQIFAHLCIPFVEQDAFRCWMKRDILRIVIGGCWRTNRTEFDDIIRAISMLDMLSEILWLFPEGIINYAAEPEYILEDIAEEIMEVLK